MKPVAWLVLFFLSIFFVSLLKGELKFVSEFQSGLRSITQIRGDCPAMAARTNFSTETDFPVLDELESRNHTEQELIINVLLCLSGDGRGFLEETKVAIKSLVLNAPHRGQLHIYIVVDQTAYKALQPILNETLPLGTVWWCPIVIQIIDISSEIKGWRREVYKIHPMPVAHHTWGTYYRLFFNRYLPSNVKHILYMDPDTVITANLANLWKHTKQDSDWLFLWRLETAGFLLLRNTPELWELASQVNASGELPQTHFNDQTILKLIVREHPNVAGELPPEWGMHWAGEWKHRKKFTQAFPKLGMGHFNGGGLNPGAFWNASLKDDLDLYYDQWGSLFYYYIHMPWTYARFVGESSATFGGYIVTINFHGNAKDLVRSPV